MARHAKKRAVARPQRNITPDPYKNMPAEKPRPEGYGEFRFKCNLRFKNKKQKELFNSIMDNRITFVRGPAGTAKTYISLYAALETIKNPDFNINKIVLSKPIVEVTSNKGLGALPGDIAEKTNAYFSHFYDNLVKLIGKDALKFLKEKGVIEEVVLNYVRGSTLGSYDEKGNPVGVIAILDECFTLDTNICISIKDKGRPFKKSTFGTIKKRLNNNEDVFVLSYNEETKELENKKVIHFFENGEKEIVKIYLGCAKIPIKTTKNHPFYCINDGNISQKQVKDINKGDVLLRLKKSNSNNCSIITKESYDIILGFMLGDGSLSKNKQKNNIYRICINHGLQQLEYFNFCKSILNANKKRAVSGYTGKEILGLQTKSIFFDNKFVSSFHNGKNKYITKDIINYISERTMAIWIMDDGSFARPVRGDGYILLHTEGFSYEENCILSEVIKEKFNLTAQVQKQGDYYILRFLTEDSAKLAEMVKDYIHPTLLYKINKDKNNFNTNDFEINKYDNLTISHVNKIENAGTEKVYNIEVEDNNNYFANMTLVHNCQNTTPKEMKTLISRMGEGTKLVILGDSDQIDLRLYEDEECGLDDAIDRLHGIEMINLIEFNEDEIVRDPFLIEIMKRYKGRNG